MQKTADEELLRKAKQEVSQCDRCGTCLPVCPLFAARDVESSSARGKNLIARALIEGGIEPSADALAAVNFCLLCRACVDTCPNKIRTDEAMINMRQYLVGRTGILPTKHRAAAALLKSRTLVKCAAGALALLRSLGLNALLPHGLVPEEVTRENFLAAFAGPASLSGQAPRSGMTVSASARVAYFQGCGMRMLFPAAAAATRARLKTATALEIKDNVCCGLPHLAHGMRAEFLALLKKNIRLYEDVDVIVSDCASCSGTLKHAASYCGDDPLWKDRAAAFSGKVMDLAEYLVNIGYRPRRTGNVTFTYHDPCHLARGQGIRKEPRDLLQAAGRFIEMEDADRCCGGAGSFSLEHPAIAAKILAKKRESIVRTGAEVVVTSCPGCLIQLSRAAKDSGGRFKAMHLSQVI